jgi:hypothetical protein
MSESNYKSVDDAKTKLEADIDAAIATSGVWEGTTCPSGGVFGWDMLAHYALEWFARNCPEKWHVSRISRHGCLEWAITAR